MPSTKIQETCITCPSVTLFLFLSIVLFYLFYCMWLRICSLQKLTESKFKGEFAFTHISTNKVQNDFVNVCEKNYH